MSSWNEIISKEKQNEYYQKGIIPFCRAEYSSYECYPSKENIFRAFYSIPTPEDVKVVILGQDPYHEPGQANGLAFSVNHNVTMPPSLQNIIKEIEAEYNKKYNGDGDLTYLAKQGVLLLNSTLTVRKGCANSHSNCGWTIFTDNIIKELAKLNKPMVFMLWGKYAKAKECLINNDKCLILKASHPSPYSASYGFFGCNHFVQCNNFLIRNNIQPIDWFGGEKC